MSSRRVRVPWKRRRCVGRVQSGAGPEPRARHWRCAAARNGVLRAGIPHPDGVKSGRGENIGLKDRGGRVVGFKGEGRGGEEQERSDMRSHNVK